MQGFGTNENISCIYFNHLGQDVVQPHKPLSRYKRDTIVILHYCGLIDNISCTWYHQYRIWSFACWPPLFCCLILGFIVIFDTFSTVDTLKKKKNLRIKVIKRYLHVWIISKRFVRGVMLTLIKGTESFLLVKGSRFITSRVHVTFYYDKEKLLLRRVYFINWTKGLCP